MFDQALLDSSPERAPVLGVIHWIISVVVGVLGILVLRLLRLCRLAPIRVQHNSVVYRDVDLQLCGISGLSDLHGEQDQKLEKSHHAHCLHYRWNCGGHHGPDPPDLYSGAAEGSTDDLPGGSAPTAPSASAPRGCSAQGGGPSSVGARLDESADGYPQND